MPVSGSLGTMAVLLFETALGGLALLWVAPLWGVVRSGFFKLVGSVLVACAAIAWATGRSALGAVGWTSYSPAGPAVSYADLAVTFLGVFALVMGVWYALLWAGWAPRPRPAAAAAKDGAAPAPATGGGRALAARVVGIAALVPGLGAAWSLAQAGGRPLEGALALLTGALFLGATVDGLLLGHWYLVDRRLTNRPIAVLATWLLASVGAALVSASLGGDRGTATVNQSLSPLLAVPNLTIWLAVGFVAVVGLLAWFIRVLVRGGSIQAATGMFYLAVIMAVAAEFSAKVYFFQA
jgi:hypothetical protein